MHGEGKRDGRLEKKSISVLASLAENLSNFSMSSCQPGTSLAAIITNTTVSAPWDFILTLSLGHRC